MADNGSDARMVCSEKVGEVMGCLRFLYGYMANDYHIYIDYIF